jgi:hypothetical protein
MPDETDLWYVMIEKVREGPLSKQDIQYLLSQKQIDGTTMAWHKGMDTWHRLRDLPEFRPNPTPDPTSEKPAQAAPSGAAAQPTSQGLASLGLWPKLAALLISLGLTAGGVYWTVLRPPSQPEIVTDTATEVTELLTRLDQDDAGVEQALADLGSQSVRPLMDLLQNQSDLSSGSVKRILVAIGPTGISNLSGYLNSDIAGVPVRIYVIQVLGEIGGLQALPSLVQVLGDPNQQVQIEAVQAIAGLGPQATPNLIIQLQSPVQNASPLARRNLVKAIASNADQTNAPALERARALERDPEVKDALVEVLGRLADIKAQLSASKRPGDSPPSGYNSTTPVASRPVDRPAPRPQPVDVRVHASAEAKATITDEREKDPKKAAEEADKGEEHRQNGNDQEALDAYRQAYAQNPLPMYFLIIIELEAELEAELADTTKTDSTSAVLPPSPVTLQEIYEELSSDEPDMTPFSDSPAFWVGRLTTDMAIARDGGRRQYVISGTRDGEDFVASVPSDYLKRKEILTNDLAEWQGRLQGFKIVVRGNESKILPVLLIDEL